MSHPRKRIRDAIVDAIKNRDTIAGLRIFPNRVTQLFPEELPLVLVYSRDERASVEDVAPLLYRRELRVGIEIAIQAADSVDDDLDALANDIEYGINQDVTLGGICKSILLTETDITIDGQGEQPIGVCRLTFEVTYFTEAVADDSLLLDAKTISSDLVLSENGAPISQTITLQT